MGHVRQIGIVTGLAIEAHALRRAVRLERLEDRVFVAPSGGDKERIGELARQFAEHGAEALFSIGLAAALSPELKTSSLVVPNKIIFEDGSEFLTEPKLNALIAVGIKPERAAEGDLLCVEKEVADAAEKRALAKTTGAVALDMESGHLARAATEIGVAFAALRIVLDEAKDSLPPSVLGLLRRDGSTDVGKLLKKIAKRPADLPPLVGLWVDSISALSQLSRVARPVFRQLF